MKSNNIYSICFVNGYLKWKLKLLMFLYIGNVLWWWFWLRSMLDLNYVRLRIMLDLNMVCNVKFII